MTSGLNTASFHLGKKKKKKRVSTNMSKKIRVGRSEIFFLSNFCLLEKNKNVY